MRILTPKEVKTTYAIGLRLTLLVAVAVPYGGGYGVEPYLFERVNEHNFHSQGWAKQEVNLIPGLGTQFSDESA